MDVTTHFIQYFSSWSHLKRSVAWILRYKQLLLSLSQKRKSLKMALTQSGMAENQQRQQMKHEMEKKKAKCKKGELSVSFFLFVTAKDRDTMINSQFCKRENK